MLPAYFQASVLKKSCIVMEQEIAIYIKLGFHMNLQKPVYSIASINNCPSDIKCKIYTHSLSGLIS